MTEFIAAATPSDIIAAMAVLATLFIAVGGTWAQFRLASGQRTARLADFENDNLRELRGHIANFLDATTRKLVVTDKLEKIAPNGLAPTDHPSLIAEFIQTARDRDDTFSSQGNAYEQIRLILIEQTAVNVALIAELRKAIDAKTNSDLLGLSVLSKARDVIGEKVTSIRNQI